MERSNISRGLYDNEKYIREILGESPDIILRHFVIPAFKNCRAFILCIDGLVDAMEIDDIVLRPLMAEIEFPMQKNFISSAGPIRALKEAGVLSADVKESKVWSEILDAALSGETALFVESCDTAVILSSRGYSTRSISEPLGESEVRASREGFIENLRTNTALVRRRIKDYSLRIESMKIGERTKTDVAIVYIDNLVDKGILGELKSRLERIRVDSILETGYIEELINDAPLSPFPTIDHTERPDKACACILEGRIVVLVDNTPFCLIAPSVFWQFFQATGDYYEKFYYGTFLRVIRFVALFISLTLSSLYVLLSSFHQEMYPTALALRVAAGREGVPFPAIIEVFFMELMFEIMREAGVRMPKPVGSAVSIVGALVIGEAAVSAGLVSPTLVIFVAAAGISSLALPSYSLSIGFRLLRYPIILLSSIFGLLGFLGGTIAVMIHLLSLRSFGAPYMSPVIPFRVHGNKDVVLRIPWWKMKLRPQMGKAQDTVRQADTEEIKPKPPKIE